MIPFSLSGGKAILVEGVEVRCLSAKHPDESELRDDDIADEAKPRAPHELERTLRLSFHLTEWLPRGEKVGDQVHAGKGGKCEVTGVPCCLEGASQEDAVLRAVLEVVERDALMLSWLCRLPGRRRG